MLLPRFRRTLISAAATLVAVAALAIVAGPRPARANELEKLDSSLKLIPADAAFYSVSLRNREKYEAVIHSRAWKKLLDLPALQMGLALYQMQAANAESVPGKIAAALKDPQVRKLLDLAGDMVSQEVFIYGDADCVDIIELVQSLSSAMRFGPALAQLDPENKDLSPDEIQRKVLIATLVENAHLIGVPDFIVGFKLKNTAAAKEHLAKLETVLQAALAEQPEVKDCLKRQKIDGHEYLTFAVDGKMIPWDDVPLDELRDYEPEAGDLNKIIDALKELKLVLAIGLRGDYLLVSVGSSTDALEQLGKGERLIDSKEFKPLVPFAGKRLAAVDYVSKELAARLAGSAEDIDNLVATVESLLPLAELGDVAEQKLNDDLNDLGKDLKAMLPEPGAMLGFSFLTSAGVEGYGYNWTENKQLDGSKPLGLLAHLGGSPLLGAVGRGRQSPADYDLLVKWIKKAFGYFETLALPAMPPDDRKKFDDFLAAAKPHLAQIDKTNRELVLPALKDGQTAVVLDAKLQSKQYLQALPATEQAMPMLELGIVVGVSDAKRLREGFGQYRTAINGLIDAARKVDGEREIPAEVRLPEPKESKVKAGTIFAFPLPEPWGVDKTIAPNFGLSRDVGVFSLSPGHTQRLLTATPLPAAGVLSPADKPRAAAVVFDFPALLDAITPWIDFAIERVSEEKDNVEQGKLIAGQVHNVLDVLKVFRRVTSESYFEDGALVSHSLLEIRDLAE